MPFMPAGHPDNGKGFPSFKRFRMTVALLDERATLRPDPAMGFNRRKMEDQRRQAGRSALPLARTGR